MEQQMSFDPMTGQTSGDAPKKGMSKGAKIGITVAAAAVVVGGGVFAMAQTGVFSSKSDKVVDAIENTFKDESKLMEALNVESITSSDAFTLGGTMSTDASGYQMDVQLDYRVDSKQQQLAGNFNMGGIAEVGGNITLTEEELLVAAPKLLDQVVVYNFKEKNDGAFIQSMAAQSGLDSDALNEMFSSLSGNSDIQEKAEKFVDRIEDEYQKLNMETVEDKKFEVDGKERSCDGYKLTVTGQSLSNMLDGYVEYYKDIVPEMLTGELVMGDFQQQIDEAKNYLKVMKDFDVYFYVYEDKLACISAEMDMEEKMEMQLLFKGGDYRMQNVDVMVNQQNVASWSGQRDGAVEKQSLSVMGQEMASLTFDSESGDLSITSEETGNIDLNIKNSKNEFRVVMNELMGQQMNLEVYLTKGAKMEEVEGDRFDLGKASEEEFQEFAEQLSSLASMFGM